MPPKLLTSLALLKPSIGAPPFSPGRSTATKLALTLLTGLLLFEISEGLGDRPRLGGEVEWSLALFSNIARRFLTPPLPEFADMTGQAQDKLAIEHRYGNCTAWTREGTSRSTIEATTMHEMGLCVAIECC